MRKFKLISVFVFAMALSLTGNVRADDNGRTESTETAQQGKPVSGKVSDANGPVIGASVSIKGTSVGTITDAEGNFTLRSVSNGDVIAVTYLGYATKEITYSGQPSLSVTIEEDVHQLEEVVVTALGITKEAKKLGYAVSTINADDLIKTGSPNFATALYGKASGVRIQSIQGGAAAGVSINVRGLSSLEGNTQPLIILNGVPIRNGNVGDSSADFADIGGTSGSTAGRARANGLVDINPEDIENLTILKGAAATALYGSEAANGAIIITSKKAQGKGITINVNATLQSNMVAYVPKIQTSYGPGASTGELTDYQKEHNRFSSYTDANGKTWDIPDYTSQASWGPKFDGREVLYWDGNPRAYSAISSDPWKELFRNGFDQIYNIAISQGSDNSTSRFSYTYLDEIPNVDEGTFKKHNFNLVGSLKYNEHLSLDYSGNFIAQMVHNRALHETSLYNSWSNMFQAFMDVPLLREYYDTSLGYKNNDKGVGLTPDEAFKVPSEGQVNGLRNLFWDIYHRNSDETNYRFLGSVAPQWKINDYLTARGRVSIDHTSEKIISKDDSEFPASADQTSSSGGYSTSSKLYSIIYGDALLMFDKKITDMIEITATAGWQGRTETMNTLTIGTNGGLKKENYFNIQNSYRTIEMSDNTERKMYLLKTAWLGTLGFSYGNFLFLEATGRSEKTSSLPQDARTYFYPSVSASFLFSNAFSLPDWYDYGKFRISYGIVGNAPEPYKALQYYNLQTAPGWTYIQVPSELGNSKLKPEKTEEFEIGLENKMFKNRFAFEVSYYNRNITDMLIPIGISASSGFSKLWSNVGAMTNKGVELAVSGTPVQTKDFAVDLRFNLGFNRNKVTALADGIPYLEAGGYAGSLGWNRSFVGRPMGDWVTYVPKYSPDGQPIVTADGYYDMNQVPQTVGNAMPKAVGGFGATFSYKNFSLDIMTDFRIGGYVFNEMYQYTMTLGINPDTENREGAGFYTYTTPDGKYTSQNGVILDGVVDNGDGTYSKNTTVVPYDDLTAQTYNWGGGGQKSCTLAKSIFENTYWKLRELNLSYQVPVSFIKAAYFKNLTVSVFGRNLFYFYKTIPNYDPETSTGTSWKNQLQVGGSASPTRTIGLSLRATF
jgi:TonB-linked SusC/RagA family outer membrane protein